MIQKVQNYIQDVNFNKEANEDKHRLTFLITLEIILLGLTLLIQEYLRPNKVFKTELGVFLMGTLPSLFGAAAYVMIIFVFHKMIQSHHQKFQLNQSLFIANSISFSGLTLWELIRTVIYPLDFWDIAASFAGCVISTILIYTLYQADVLLIDKHTDKQKI